MAKKFFIEITNFKTNETHVSEFNQGKTFHSIKACQKFIDDNFVIVDDKDNFVVSHWEMDQNPSANIDKTSYLGTHGRQSIELQKGIDVYLPYESDDQGSVSNWIIRVGSDPAISDNLKNKYIVFKNNKALVGWTDKMAHELRPEAVLRLYALRGQYPVLENTENAGNDNNDNHDNNIHSLDNPQSVWKNQKEIVEHRFFMEGKKGVEIFETKPNDNSDWLVKSLLIWKKLKTRVSITGVSNKDRVKNITIPVAINGKPVKSIGNWVFNRCKNLKNIVIPNSVTFIGWGAFGGCTSLENVVIPNSVTSIGDHALSNCTNLKNIIIPNSVVSIEWGAFYNCKGLTKIIVKATTPPSLNKCTFDNNAQNRKIFVPKKALDDYKQKWSDYKDDIFPIE